jgi:hypothetical protein
MIEYQLLWSFPRQGINLGANRDDNAVWGTRRYERRAVETPMRGILEHPPISYFRSTRHTDMEPGAGHGLGISPDAPTYEQVNNWRSASELDGL